MSVSLTTVPFNHPTPSSTFSSQRQGSTNSSFGNNMSNFFGSIKKSLSKRSSNPRGQANLAPSSHYSASRGANSLAAPQSGTSPFRAVASQGISGKPSDPPPAYTATPIPAHAPTSANGGDDPYAFLSTFDTVFLIDDSGSMAGRSWREVGQALEIITPICAQRDADGIDIHFLNHRDEPHYRQIKLAGTIIEIFQTVRPGGATPTGQRLSEILRPYVNDLERGVQKKPMNIIVLTDGEPSDDLEAPIVRAARKLDKLDAPAWQIGIQFVQVGKEAGATKHLRQLDDDLAELAGGDLRDIVDTMPFKEEEGDELTAAGIMKVVLGSVNRRLDRNSKDLHRRGTS